MSPFLFVITQFAIVAYALLGGVFLAFSDFIMRSLSLTRGAVGVEATQIINREVFRWVFRTLFLGIAVVSMLIAGVSTTGLEGSVRLLIPSAALVYLTGCFGVPVLLDVPMNDALARMQPKSGAACVYWTGIYILRRTLWNSVRSVACISSAALALFGLFSV